MTSMIGTHNQQNIAYYDYWLTHNKEPDICHSIKEYSLQELSISYEKAKERLAARNTLKIKEIFNGHNVKPSILSSLPIEVVHIILKLYLHTQECPSFDDLNSHSQNIDFKLQIAMKTMNHFWEEYEKDCSDLSDF